MTDTRLRPLLYLVLVQPHLSYASETWMPRIFSGDLAILEGVQRRASKFLLQEHELSYHKCLKKLNNYITHFLLLRNKGSRIVNMQRWSLRP